MRRTKILEQRPAFARFHSPEALIVSTYQLQSEGEQRTGALHIMNHDLEKDSVIETTAGVFRFEFMNSHSVVSALTDGSLSVANVKDLTVDAGISVSDTMLLDVSLCGSAALTSDKNGKMYLADLNTQVVISEWDAHSLPYTGEGCEVWTCSFLTPQYCVSGAEDASMILWDLASHTKISQTRIFGSGVTFVAGSDEYLILTGSYDDHVRLFDRRNLKEVLKENKLSGGVWNIEQHDNGRLVAACMYGGWAVLDADLQKIQADETPGANLLYGATLSGNTLAYATFNDYTDPRRSSSLPNPKTHRAKKPDHPPPPPPTDDVEEIDELTDAIVHLQTQDENDQLLTSVSETFGINPAVLKEFITNYKRSDSTPKTNDEGVDESSHKETENLNPENPNPTNPSPAKKAKMTSSLSPPTTTQTTPTTRKIAFRPSDQGRHLEVPVSLSENPNHPPVDHRMPIEDRSYLLRRTDLCSSNITLLNESFNYTVERYGLEAARTIFGKLTREPRTSFAHNHQAKLCPLHSVVGLKHPLYQCMSGVKYSHRILYARFAGNCESCFGRHAPTVACQPRFPCRKCGLGEHGTAACQEIAMEDGVLDSVIV